MNNNKPRIALLVGGTSPEREVSKMSGEGIYNALISLGYPTIIIDPAYGTNQPNDEKLFFANDDYTELSNRNCVTAINSELFDNIDVVFSALHGKWAEDGMMQSLLELRGLKYTGSKVLGSAIAMDKALSKTIFKQNKIPTPSWLVADNSNQSDSKLIGKINDEIGFPCVIKPNDQGSTVGLTVVKNESEVERAVDLALKFSAKALIEEYIEGREITVAILEDEALSVLEIVPHSGLYDYESKYTSGMSEYIVPANLPQDITQKASEFALSAFNVLGCESYARVDFRLSDDGVPYCLEVNTLPGMTPLSLVPKMANAVGITFEELIDRIIKHAL
jgi:D-alanine-D-alanine ligase